MANMLETHEQIKSQKWIDELVAEAMAIEAEEAHKAGTVGYTARLLAQATLPYKKSNELIHSRNNGFLTVIVEASPRYGLPYGHIPRLVLNWITTEAVRTQSPILELGNNLSCFMKALRCKPTGGSKGSIRALRKQIDSLFGCSIISIEEREPGVRRESRIIPIEARELWWDPRNPDQDCLYKSRLALSLPFFKLITDKPIPIDMRILWELAKLRSPMAIDIYCWLTYRASYLHEPMKHPIPWALIQLQMGAHFKNEKHFREEFLQWLKVVKTLYPHIDVEVVEPKRGRNGGGGGLILKPCRPSVLPKIVLA